MNNLCRSTGTRQTLLDARGYGQMILPGTWSCNSLDTQASPAVQTLLTGVSFNELKHRTDEIGALCEPSSSPLHATPRRGLLLHMVSSKSYFPCPGTRGSR